MVSLFLSLSLSPPTHWQQQQQWALVHMLLSLFRAGEKWKKGCDAVVQDMLYLNKYFAWVPVGLHRSRTYILAAPALLGNPVSSDELRATEKVMTCTILCVGLIIKAASVGIGPYVSDSALQSSNTSEISLLFFLPGKDKLMIQWGRQMKLIFPLPDRNRV